MRKIVLVNQKGGCGKTTTSINVAYCLAAQGNKVLLIDLDPQGHSGLGLGVQPDQKEESIYEVLAGDIDINQAIQPLNENFDAVFSNVVLSAFEQLMAGVPEREYVLARSLSDINKSYDYLVIDSPPSVGLLTFNGLLAADEAIIPVDSSPFSLSGLGKLLETMQLIEKQTGHAISFRTLATNIDRRTNYSKAVVERLKNWFPDNRFETVINACTRLREAADQGMPIAEYDKRCAAFHDYHELTEEIIDTEAQAEVVQQTEEKDIMFSLDAPRDAVVQIAGDFTDWQPQPLNLTGGRNGSTLWQKAVRLKPGFYQYKYIIDGEWVPDPANEKTVDNSFGSVNSFLTV